MEVDVPRTLGADCWQKGRNSAQVIQDKKKLTVFPNSLCVYDFLSTITLKLQCYTRLYKDESIF